MGQRATRLPSSDVSFSKGTTAIFFGTTGSFPVSAVRTEELEAHPKNAIETMQRVAMNAEEVLEKGFTVSPRQECLRPVHGWNNEQKKEDERDLSRTLVFVFQGDISK